MRKFKKLMAALMCVAMVLALAPVATVSAADDVDIVIDSKSIVFVDTDGSVLAPILQNGTTYLPARALAKVVGSPIAWEGDTNTVYIGSRDIVAPYSSQVKVYVDNRRIETVDANGNSVPPFILNGRTYIPVRAVSEAFGMDVKWDGGTRTVFLRSPEVYNIILTGDWSGVSNSDTEEIKRLFSLYPKLMARWGVMGNEKKTLLARMDYWDGEVVDSFVQDGHTVNVIEVEGGTTSEHVVRLNKPEIIEDKLTVTHELTHAATDYKTAELSWWNENLAEYGRFRYFVPTYVGQKAAEELDKNDSEVRDWGWEPYGKCEWFFAYMDYFYPTHITDNGDIQLGLIDTLNSDIKHGLIESDGGTAHNDANFNAVVKKITGFDNMEQLRKQYVSDLDSGKWTFNGFEGYKDNFLTENVDATVNFVWDKDNILYGAKVVEYTGEKAENGAMNIVDNDFDTSWSCGDGSSVVFDLGADKTFSKYSILPTEGVVKFDVMKENGDGRAVNTGGGAWELLVSDDMQKWSLIDAREGKTGCAASFDLGRKVTARYVKLEVVEPVTYISYENDPNDPYLVYEYVGCNLPEISELMLFND